MVSRDEIDFENIEWQVINGLNPNRLIEPNKVYGGVIAHQQNICIKFTIGEYVCNKLGWKKKDKIIIHQDPNFEFNFLLVKTASKSGLRLQNVMGNAYSTLQFVWRGKSVISKSKSKELKYKIIRDNQLAFQYIPDESEVKQ